MHTIYFQALLSCVSESWMGHARKNPILGVFAAGFAKGQSVYLHYNCFLSFVARFHDNNTEQYWSPFGTEPQ